MPYKDALLWLHRPGPLPAYVYDPMKTTARSRIQRSLASAMLLLFAWSALVPALYRMDCLNSGRSVSSWFEPIKCQPTGNEATGKEVAPTCCIFYKADAAKGPISAFRPAPAHILAGTDVLMASLVVIQPDHRPVARFIHGHGPPPLDQGQRLARLSFLRV